jgi:hypothetical protein
MLWFGELCDNPGVPTEKKSHFCQLSKLIQQLSIQTYQHMALYFGATPIIVLIFLKFKNE